MTCLDGNVTLAKCFYAKLKPCFVIGIVRIRSPVAVNTALGCRLLTGLQSTPLCRPSIYFFDETIFAINISVRALWVFLRQLPL